MPRARCSIKVSRLPSHHPQRSHIQAPSVSPVWHRPTSLSFFEGETRTCQSLGALCLRGASFLRRLDCTTQAASISLDGRSPTEATNVARPFESAHSPLGGATDGRGAHAHRRARAGRVIRPRGRTAELRPLRGEFLPLSVLLLLDFAVSVRGSRWVCSPRSAEDRIGRRAAASCGNFAERSVDFPGYRRLFRLCSLVNDFASPFAAGFRRMAVFQ